MAWPLSQDYNEAIQDPASSFADPEVKQGEAATNALGIPMPRSGNFADVYEVTTPRGKWAVKCFTRQIPGLRERYKEISAFLKQTPLPFMVEFTYLEQGIRVRGDWYPVLKMNWVEGFTLNQFVKDNLERPQVLDLLCQIWVKLAAKLREAQIAHCDLQHGNVLLVPGSKVGALAVKLVDYDGMCVPALTMLKTIELGHPNFQHPQRAKEGIYSLEVDRFSHLVIYTAIRALITGGKVLWTRYDNGDNLLFKASDFEKPNQSPLFAALSTFPDRGVQMLVEQMLGALRRPLAETPLLEELAPTLPGTGVKKVTTGLKKRPEDPFSCVASGAATDRIAKKGSGLVVGLVASGVVAVLAIIGAVAFLMSGNSDETGEPSTKVAQKKSEPKPPESNKAESKKDKPKKEERKVAKKLEPPSPNKASYLSEMQEESAVVEGQFTKGPVGNGARGLFTHPLNNAPAIVKYRIRKQFHQFLGEAAIMRGEQQGPPATPLTFEVVLDGKSAWKSNALSKIGESQSFDVDVTGADVMELKVHCPGNNGSAWAIWIEPRLLTSSEPRKRPLYFVRMRGDQLLTDVKEEVDLVEKNYAGSKGTFLGFGYSRQQPGTKKLYRYLDTTRHVFDVQQLNGQGLKEESLGIWVPIEAVAGTEPIYKLQLPDGCFIYGSKSIRDNLVQNKEAQDLGVIFHLFTDAASRLH
jgi:hypothetical protein